jgi:hypothetical protein
MLNSIFWVLLPGGISEYEAWYAKYGVWGQTPGARYSVPDMGYGVRPRGIDIVYPR